MRTTYVLFIALHQTAELVCDGYLTGIEFKRFRIGCHHWFYNNDKRLSSVRVYCFSEAVKHRSYEFETRIGRSCTSVLFMCFFFFGGGGGMWLETVWWTDTPSENPHKMRIKDSVFQKVILKWNVLGRLMCKRWTHTHTHTHKKEEKVAV